MLQRHKLNPFTTVLFNYHVLMQNNIYFFTLCINGMIFLLQRWQNLNLFVSPVTSQRSFCDDENQALHKNILKMYFQIFFFPDKFTPFSNNIE